MGGHCLEPDRLQQVMICAHVLFRAMTGHESSPRGRRYRGLATKVGCAVDSATGMRSGKCEFLRKLHDSRSATPVSKLLHAQAFTLTKLAPFRSERPMTPITQPPRISRALQLGILALFFLLTLSSASQAGPLGVNINPYPVIVAGFITSAYDAETGVFLAEGVMRTLDTGTGRVAYPNNPFRLSANISNSGVGTGGYFSIDGGALIGSTTLRDFAFVPMPNGAMEFLFAPATGSLVSNGTYDATEPIDVLLTGLGTAFTGSFATSWQSTTFATAQIREDPDHATAIPEPSTLSLLLTAAAGFVLTRRRARPTIGRPVIVS